MIIYKFIKYLRLYIKYAKVWKAAAIEEQLLMKLSQTLQSEFRMDWVGRAYTVFNPRILKRDPVNGMSTQIFEFNADGTLSDQTWINQYILTKLQLAKQFMFDNSIFDILTYKLEKLDDFENYLCIFQPVYWEECKKWTIAFIIELLVLIAATITLCCIL